MGLTSPASGVGRGAFLKELASGVAVGTVAFGLTVEGAGAYEVKAVYIETVCAVR